jgi:hypothetical protein
VSAVPTCGECWRDVLERLVGEGVGEFQNLRVHSDSSSSQGGRGHPHIILAVRDRTKAAFARDEQRLLTVTSREASVNNDRPNRAGQYEPHHGIQGLGGKMQWTYNSAERNRSGKNTNQGFTSRLRDFGRCGLATLRIRSSCEHVGQNGATLGDVDLRGVRSETRSRARRDGYSATAFRIGVGKF